MYFWVESLLQSLRIDRAFLDGPNRLPARGGGIEIDLPDLSAVESLAWKATLHDLHRECGCSAGAAAVVAALTVLVVAAVGQSGGVLATTWREAVGGLLIIPAAAMMGKGLGIGWARVKLRRKLDELRVVVDRRANVFPLLSEAHQ